MFRIVASARQRLKDPQVREFLAWCLPALLLGIALRIVLTMQMPYGYYHDDTPDFLATPAKLLSEHKWELRPKKTWLVPALYTAPFLLRIPALFVIPLFQHALGAVQIVLVGLLCRLWFKHWKWFIVPLTLIAAANPFFLWYEHTLLAESVYLFCTVLLAVAGTLYALEQTRARFWFLCGALFLEAGARPEGKLLFGFGILLLVLLHFRDWRAAWQRMAFLLVLGIATHFVTKTSQAGLLLYTSVAYLTPSPLRSAPGFDQMIADTRERLQQRWREELAFPKVRDRKQISDTVEAYLKANPGKVKAVGKRGINELCLRLAKETCLRNLPRLPELTYYKFRSDAQAAPSGLFDNRWIFDKQSEAYSSSEGLKDEYDRMLYLSRGLVGEQFTSKEDVDRFVAAHFHEIAWFNAWTQGWLSAVNAIHFPDRFLKSDAGASVMPGLPVYYVVAAFGLAAVMFRRGTLQPFHIAWGLALFGLFFVIILTANPKPRFRFVFEPFWFLYVGLAADTLFSLFRTAARRREARLEDAPILTHP